MIKEKFQLLTLMEGKNDYEFLSKRQYDLQQMVIEQSGPEKRSCVAIEMKIALESDLYWDYPFVGIHWLGLFALSIAKSIKQEDVFEAQLYFTSENNSYGVVFQKWFDGRIEALQLSKGEYKAVQIAEIRQYDFLKTKCTASPFYDCIVSKIKERGIQCTSYTLPHDYPICPRNETTAELINPMSIVGLDCLGPKTCSVKEYVLKEEYQ